MLQSCYRGSCLFFQNVCVWPLKCANAYKLLQCKWEHEPSTAAVCRFPTESIFFQLLLQDQVCVCQRVISEALLKPSWLPHWRRAKNASPEDLSPCPASRSLRTLRSLFRDTQLWWPVNTLPLRHLLPPAWWCLSGHVCLYSVDLLPSSSANTHPTLECKPVCRQVSPVWI